MSLSSFLTFSTGGFEGNEGLDDEVILRVDKGNAIVVMERSDYEGKIRELLNDTYLPSAT